MRYQTSFFQLVLISWMVTLSSCMIWQIISFILPPNEYGCVYAWTMLGSGPEIDLQKMPILPKKIIFSDEAHFDLQSAKQTNKQNCLIWGTENPHAFWSRIEFGHFSSKMSNKMHLQSMAIVIGPCWTNFCSRKLKRRILAIFGFNSTRCFVLCFWISHNQVQSWYHLATSEKRCVTVGLLFVGCRQR